MSAEGDMQYDTPPLLVHFFTLQRLEWKYRKTSFECHFRFLEAIKQSEYSGMSRDTATATADLMRRHSKNGGLRTKLDLEEKWDFEQM